MIFNFRLSLAGVMTLFWLAFSASLFAEDGLEELPLEDLQLQELPLDDLEPLTQDGELEPLTSDDQLEEIGTSWQKEGSQLEELAPLPAPATALTTDSLSDTALHSVEDAASDTASSVDEREFIKKVIDFKQEDAVEPEAENEHKKSNYYESFLENPASIAYRDISYFAIPLGFTLSYKEAELSWEDFVKMYKQDKFVSQMDDELSADSWDVCLGLRKTLLNVGYENFQINSDLILEAEIKDLGVQWVNFLLDGENKEKEMILADKKGEGTQVVAFVKNSLAYAVPNSFVFGQTAINFGLNINIYNSIGYAKIDKLAQTEGATEGEKSLECEYTRSKFNGANINHSMGLGLGAMIDGLPDLLFLDEGRAYLSVDDLFGKLSFSDVEKVRLSRVVSKKGGELDTVVVDTTYELADLNIALDPEYSLGISYNLFRESFFGSMYLVSKYRQAMVAYDQGFSVGVDYLPFKCLPIQLRYGMGEDPYFSAAITLDLAWQLGVRYVGYGSDPASVSQGFTVGLDFLRIKF